MADANDTLAAINAPRISETIGDYVNGFGNLFGFGSKSKETPKLPVGNNVLARSGETLPPNGDEVSQPDPLTANPLATASENKVGSTTKAGLLDGFNLKSPLVLGAIAVGVIFLLTRKG